MILIPFNHLGYLFNAFGRYIYPSSVRSELCLFLESLIDDARVLDIGAGTGVMSEFAYQCRNDLALVAIDPAEGMLKFTAEYIETQEGIAEDLPFDDNSFDLVLMGESLHHFGNIEDALTETIRVLDYKGSLFVYDFDVSTFVGKQIYLMEKLLGEPANFFEPEVLKNKLENMGFRVELKQYGWRYCILGVLEE